MNRRDFCRLAGATTLLPPAATTLSARAASLPADDYAAAFEAERAAHPWTIGYAGLEADVEAMPLTLRGRIPAALARRLLPQRPGTP